MFAQQATAPYLDAGQQQQNFAAATTQGAVSSGQTGYIQVTPAGTGMQAQRHPITHTTRASPATVSSFGFRGKREKLLREAWSMPRQMTNLNM